MMPYVLFQVQFSKGTHLRTLYKRVAWRLAGWQVHGRNTISTDKKINPLAPELFFLILAHFVYKMWIIQEPNKLALWNKLHIEEKKTESIEHV